jgi:hypothetical protein
MIILQTVLWCEWSANKDGSSGSIYRTSSGTVQPTFPFTLFKDNAASNPYGIRKYKFLNHNFAPSKLLLRFDCLSIWHLLSSSSFLNLWHNWLVFIKFIIVPS